MGVRLDMALGKVLAILTVTFLAEGVNGSPSIQLPVWKQKFLKNLPTLKKTPGSTALLTAQDHGNSYSPYSYSRPSTHFFSSNNNFPNNKMLCESLSLSKATTTDFLFTDFNR